MKNKKARIALAMVLIALYAFTGWLQRGWVDWLGVATVALLIAPVVTFVPGRRRNGSTE